MKTEDKIIQICVAPAYKYGNEALYALSSDGEILCLENPRSQYSAWEWIYPRKKNKPLCRTEINN